MAKCRMNGMIFIRDLTEVRIVVSPETWCRISANSYDKVLVPALMDYGTKNDLGLDGWAGHADKQPFFYSRRCTPTFPDHLGYHLQNLDHTESETTQSPQQNGIIHRPLHQLETPLLCPLSRLQHCRRIDTVSEITK